MELKDLSNIQLIMSALEILLSEVENIPCSEDEKTLLELRQELTNRIGEY